jgi:hypothetical protein
MRLSLPLLLRLSSLTDMAFGYLDSVAHRLRQISASDVLAKSETRTRVVRRTACTNRADRAFGKPHHAERMYVCFTSTIRHPKFVILVIETGDGKLIHTHIL